MLVPFCINKIPILDYNFLWPEKPNEKQVQAVQNVLDARAQFPVTRSRGSIPPQHNATGISKSPPGIRQTVDLCYRPQPFINETNRIEFLFELYDKYTSGMFVEGKKKKKKLN